MRIYLESLGCRLNYAEMAGLGRQLAGAGHELAGSPAEADLCVLNSCTVTGEAARQSRQMARQMARANPAAQLIVTGCYATLEAEQAAALPNVRWVVGNPAKDDLLRLIEESGVRGQGAGVRSQGAGVRDQGAGVRRQATRGKPQTTIRATHHAPRTTHHAPAPSSRSRTAAATTAPSAS